MKSIQSYLLLAVILLAALLPSVTIAQTPEPYVYAIGVATNGQPTTLYSQAIGCSSGLVTVEDNTGRRGCWSFSSPNSRFNLVYRTQPVFGSLSYANAIVCPERTTTREACAN